MEILKEIFEICIIPLLGVLTTYLIVYIKTKRNELIQSTNNDLAKKYIDLLSQTISDCVIATNQTYVEALKKEGKFDVEAQKEAFNKTFNKVLEILGDDVKDYLQEFYGDLNLLISQKIESEVNTTKAFSSLK